MTSRDPEEPPCETCNGSGEQWYVTRYGDATRRCPDCGGTGEGYAGNCDFHHDLAKDEGWPVRSAWGM